MEGIDIPQLAQLYELARGLVSWETDGERPFYEIGDNLVYWPLELVQRVSTLVGDDPG